MCLTSLPFPSGTGAWASAIMGCSSSSGVIGGFGEAYEAQAPNPLNPETPKPLGVYCRVFLLMDDDDDDDDDYWILLLLIIISFSIVIIISSIF